MKRKHEPDSSEEAESSPRRHSTPSHAEKDARTDNKSSNKKRKTIDEVPTSLNALDNATTRGKLLLPLREARTQQTENAQPSTTDRKKMETATRADAPRKPPKRVSFADEDEVRFFSHPSSSPSPSPPSSEEDDSSLSSPSWDIDEDDEDADALVEESFGKQEDRG